MVESAQVDPWRDRELIDVEGKPIGKIARVFADGAAAPPAWALVRAAPGPRSVFIPVGSAGRVGDAVGVPFGRGEVEDAPRPRAARGLSLADAVALLHHYGFEHLPVTTRPRHVVEDRSSTSTKQTGATAR